MIVAIEGIDACGKETQTKLLVEWAQSYFALGSWSIPFPEYSLPSGRALMRLLQTGDPDPMALQALMLTNRIEHHKLLSTSSEMGSRGLLVLDRYWLSGLVYGQCDGLDRDWLLRIHENLIQPDLWILIDISAAESFARRPDRQDAYERSRDRVQSACNLYRQEAAGRFLFGRPIVTIAGHTTPQQVHERIRDLITALR